MEQLEFEVKTLSYAEVEDIIASYYDIGYPN